MSPEALPDVSGADQEYALIWSDSTSRVLESLHGAPFVASLRPETGEPDAPPAPAADDWVTVRFASSGQLQGDHAFRLTKPDAVRMTQLLMSEPLDATAAFSESHGDALAEIFRQFAGLAATSGKAKYGGEIQFQLQASSVLEWKPVAYIAGIFSAPQVEPIQWTLLISPELQAVLGVLDAARAAKAPADVPARTTIAPAVKNVAETSATNKPAAGTISAEATTPSAGSTSAAPSSTKSRAPQPEESADTPTNLELLLDIELSASLRFGQREMLLRDILELRPGSVLELDRQIQEPAELLINGRVIARGDVVVVDGSYGLRITDIVQPHQRLESVRT